MANGCRLLNLGFGFVWVLSYVVLLTSASWAQDDSTQSWSQADLNFFETKIRPVLVDQCYRCHSEKASSLGGGLRVDSREGLLRGGDSGPAVELGEPDDSLLIEAIRYEDDNYAMPPKNAGGKLPANVIRDFEEWVRRGLPDPRSEEHVGPDPGAGEKAKSWWAFQPLQQPNVPSPKISDWSDRPIDRFILEKLESQELQPVGDAEPAVLLRRVYFDLTGLPPSAEVAKKFVSDWHSSANSDQQLALYTSIVDELLASPRFGEHWGRHWLDVARYAESSGKDVNLLYPYAYRYRDYVIDAFNADMPYNQFVQEQIAGDLLKAADDEEKTRQFVATGFLAIGAKSINEQRARQLAVDIADEQIDAYSQAFLGVTLACARCHDHKFDPISQVDYTAVAGIFLSTETHYGTNGGVAGRNAGTLLTLPNRDSGSRSRSISTNELDRLRQQLADLEKERRDLIAERARNREAMQQSELNRILRIGTEIQATRSRIAAFDENGERLAQAMGVSDKPASAGRAQAARQNQRRPQRGGTGFVSIDNSPLFIRGELDRPGDRVPRAVPDLFSDVPRPGIPRTSSGRKELAEWTTHSDNPLVSRVMVNRVWHWLFGAGIVTSVDNFGTTGAEPTHPELLDYLAKEFVANGWSVKHLIREIVLTRTYRQASTYNEVYFQIDPANAYLWRHNPKRLNAEAIRDAILMASGQLVLEQPRGSDISRAGDGVIGRARVGVSEESIAKNRSLTRSIYLPVPRDVQPEILAAFDYPDAAVVQGARQSTNVPAQILYLLNSGFVEGQSEQIARKMNEPTERRRGTRNREQNQTRSRKGIEEMSDDLSWTLYGRPATSKETAAARKLMNHHKEDPLQGTISLIRAMIASAEFRSLD
ncbi:MAG: PSD1 domain-containing protein [Pirellulaceae bacterium]|nr:PSD1 domain-containing protein [Pirellulaceae bacterium]